MPIPRFDLGDDEDDYEDAPPSHRSASPLDAADDEHAAQRAKSLPVEGAMHQPGPPSSSAPSVHDESRHHGQHARPGRRRSSPELTPGKGPFARAAMMSSHGSSGSAAGEGGEEDKESGFKLGSQDVCVCVCIYIYIYIYMCVCVCVLASALALVIVERYNGHENWIAMPYPLRLYTLFPIVLMPEVT